MNSGKKRRVVFTGLGAITPIGIGIENFWNSLKEGRSGVDWITCFDPSPFSSRVAGEIKDFDPTDYMEPLNAKRMDRFAQFAVVGARMALQDAGITIDETSAPHIGIVVGSAMGGVPLAENQHTIFLAKGIKRVSPYLNSSLFPGAAACQISIELGIKGFGNTIAGACSAGTDSLGYAYQCIKSGMMDVCLAGGSEAPLAPLCLGSFCLINALSTHNDPPEKACRPFDASRNGFVLSEGAGIMVMEELGHALKRDAYIYGEFMGYNTNFDAFHMVQPSPDADQGCLCVQRLLDDAAVHPEEIDYINAHGTSTLLNDKNETKIIKMVFGERAYKIPVSANKSMTGHTLGGAGSIEAIASLLTMKYQFLPPTINIENADADCDLDYVPNVGRAAEVHAILSNSYGFGGKNSALVLKEYTQSRMI
jgi:3-oxoacyl-[acyl-carrier-protein] synthase II